MPRRSARDATLRRFDSCSRAKCSQPRRFVRRGKPARPTNAIARARPLDAPRVRALVEVNLGAESAKSGLPPDEVAHLLDASRYKIEIVGLMTIPPPSATPERARPYFAKLREMRDRLAIETGITLSELSMGMSDDFEIAIEEGATIVRVGRAVFGE